MSNELYVIEMRGSAGHAPQEQDEEQGLLISVEMMVIIVVIIGLSCPPQTISIFFNL